MAYDEFGYQTDTLASAPNPNDPSLAQGEDPNAVAVRAALKKKYFASRPNPTVPSPWEGNPSPPQRVDITTPESTLPMQATKAPVSYTSAPVDQSIASKISAYIQANGLQANQSDPKALNDIVQHLRSQGINAQTDYTDVNGHTGGILVNGQPYQLINGSNQWTPLQAWDTSTPTPTRTSPGYTPGTVNGWTPAPDPTGSAVQAAILKQLGTLQNPTDPNSATVHAITDPYHLQSQRGLEQTRRALAEQAYASGNLNTGGYAGSQIQAVENAGANEANFTGQTVATQEAQRQALLSNILGLGTNVSEFTQQLSATQRNFADQLAQQDRQFAASLAANVAQFGQSLGYQQALFDWTRLQTGIAGATAPVPA